MSLKPVNPFPPIIFQDYFEFSEIHRAAAYEILAAATDSVTNLEIGDSQSTVANQNVAPHRHSAFYDFFLWLEEQSNNIAEQWKLDTNNKFYIGNSWINRHRLTGETVPHNHGFSLISCVAYISLPSESGFTQFKDPHYDFKNLHETRSLEEYHSIPVKQGDILFFPGWLMHKSEKSNSIQDRIILSANFVNFTHTRYFTLGSIQK